MTNLIAVRHNIECAHRLSLLPGKCENIHGHSMWIRLELGGPVFKEGLLCGLDFGTVKHAFRTHLDTEYDHRLLLNETDPWANYDLPGLRPCAGDPTTENLALWIGQWALSAFPQCPTVGVTVDETHVNSASWRHG